MGPPESANRYVVSFFEAVTPFQCGAPDEWQPWITLANPGRKVGEQPVGAELARDEGTLDLPEDRVIVHREQAQLPQKHAHSRESALRHITLTEFLGQKINQRTHRRQQPAS
nr:hypothetical protein GCM10020185_25760 [Pseudomonas brassicacearum subsp. brassicacearum]